MSLAKVETTPRRSNAGDDKFEDANDEKDFYIEDVEDMKKGGEYSYEISQTKSKVVGRSRGKDPVLEQSTREKKDRRRRCIVFVAIGFVAIISLVSLIAVLASKKTGTTPDLPLGSGETTKSPTVPCAQYLEPFSSSIAGSYLVRFVATDACLNYPSLDCFGATEVSESSLLGANLVDGTWVFEDDVGVRVIREAGQVLIRLEIRHAHDTLGDARAHVYTVVARESDMCVQSFYYYEVNVYESGRFECSTSIRQAQNHSEIVSLFLQNPTHFIERRDNIWVINSPSAKTTLRSFHVPLTEFLVGVQVDRPMARFLVSPPRSIPLHAVLDSDAELPISSGCNDDGWVARAAPALNPRMLPPVTSFDLNTEIDESGACTNACTNATEEDSLQAISTCIQACLEDNISDSGEEEGAERRLLGDASSSNNDDDPLIEDADDYGEFEKNFVPTSSIEASLWESKMAVEDEEEGLKRCIVENGSQHDDDHLRETKQLIQSIVNLDREINRTQTQLETLDRSLIESLRFIYGTAMSAMTRLQQISEFRSRVYVHLYTIRMHSSRPSTVDTAAQLIDEVDGIFEEGYRRWSDLLKSIAWNGTSEDLLALQTLESNVEKARYDLAALSLFVHHYLLPFLRARPGDMRVNSIAAAITSSIEATLALYSRYSVSDFDLPLVHEVINDPVLNSLMEEFMQAAPEALAYFQQAAQKLDVAMSSQVSLVLVATKDRRSARVKNACGYELDSSCVGDGEVCRQISSSLVQSFNQPVTSVSLDKCRKPGSQRTGCSLASSGDCTVSVQMPVFSRHLRTWIIKSALQSPGAKKDIVEDTIESALEYWGTVTALPSNAPEPSRIDHSAALLKVLRTNQEPPSNSFVTCIGSRFENNIMSCEPLAELGAVLFSSCNLLAGSKCMHDSNCMSNACIGGICCASGHANCASQCVAPEGFCLTGAPSTSPTNSPTVEPTEATLSPTIATSEPTSSPTTALPTASPTMPTSQPTTLPTVKGATPYPTKKPTTAKPTKRPTTKGPTKNPTTRRPTNLPTTARPTTTPPTTMAPTISPTKAPIVTRSPTAMPSLSPTKLPTLAPVAKLCVKPPTTCESIKTKSECDQYSACLWNVDVDICWTQDCSEFTCRIRQQTFQAASIILPGCRLGEARLCDRQRLHAFNALKLETECAATFSPVSTGGWLGKEQILPVMSPLTSTFFVSAMGGSDSNMGTRFSPYRTIQRALTESRKVAPGLRRRIILLPGEPYRVASTITLKQADSGLIIQGESDVQTGAKPRITSTISLKGATWENHNNQIIRTMLSASMVAQLDTLSMLYVNDKPAIRARFPNLDDPVGFKYQGAGSVSSWGKPRQTGALTRRVNRLIIPADLPDVKYHGKSIPYNRFSAGYGGACSHFDPPVSYFCDPAHYAQGGCPYTLPSSVTFNRAFWGKNAWSRPKTAFFHTMHWYGWGLWTFSVRSQSVQQIVLDGGGWQEARGDCGIGGGAWYVENVIELLDHPNEFFIDLVDGYLYYYPPDPSQNPLINPDISVEVTTAVRRFIEVLGESNTQPVRDVMIRNIEFFGGHATHMDAFVAPSGGDWTIHRGGAVHLEYVENSKVQGNSFIWCSGNALFLSNHIRNVDVEYNSFYGIGSTAIAVVGDPNFASQEPWKIYDYADEVRIFGNVAADVGVIVKQSAGAFVTIGKRVRMEQNVFYNGPRGGIVFNDGFGGGHIVRKNVVFQFVLETNDHGPFDTWDRQQYEEPLRPVNVVDWNIFLGTGPGPKGIDFDDGAFNWISENNVVVWGYQKFKGANIWARNNLILYPLASSCVFKTPQNRIPANWFWENNTCVSLRPPYGYNAGRAEIGTLCEFNNFQARDNTYYYLGSDNSYKSCSGSLSWNEWRTRYSQDAGSVFIRRSPELSEIEQWVNAKLDWVNEVMRGNGGRR